MVSAQMSAYLFAFSHRGSPCLGSALALPPAWSHTCLFPFQALSLPVAQMCGERRQEFHRGNLLNSHNPASARIFSLS